MNTIPRKDFVARPDEYRVVPGYPDYEVNNLGVLRLTESKTPVKEVNMAGIRFYVLEDSRFSMSSCRTEDLVSLTFPELFEA